jgi:hypothetical protein
MVFLLLPVVIAASLTVTRPCSRAISRIFTDSSGRSPGISRSRLILLSSHFLLFAQRFQEERLPGLPVRGFCPDGALCSAQREAVLLVCFDHAFQRAAWNIGISRLQQQQRVQYL